MWHNCLNEYLIKEGYKNDPICPYIFIRKFKSRFAIVVVYVDDMNLISTYKKLLKITEFFKKRI